MRRTLSLIVILFVVALLGRSAAWATPNACFTVTNNGFCSSWSFDASCTTNTTSSTTYTWYFDDGSSTADIFSGETLSRTGLGSGPWQVTLVTKDGLLDDGDAATECFWVCCVGPCGSC